MTDNEALENHKEDCRKCWDKACEHNIQCLHKKDIEVYERLIAFETIGTVEECREAVERMKPKKVKDKICDCGDYFGICPVCDRGVANQFGTPYKYCPKCGTKIDWQ